MWPKMMHSRRSNYAERDACTCSQTTNKAMHIIIAASSVANNNTHMHTYMQM